MLEIFLWILGIALSIYFIIEIGRVFKIIYEGWLENKIKVSIYIIIFVFVAGGGIVTFFNL